MIGEALQALVQECLGQLRKDNVPIVDAPTISETPRDAASAGNEPFAQFGAYDPSWGDFPTLDIFEPLDPGDLSINSAR